MNPDNLAAMAWTQFWQLTLLIAIVAVIVRLAARRRPHLAHVLWLVVLVKCLTPPLMASPGGIFCWMQPPRSSAVVVNKYSAVLPLLENDSDNEPSRIALLADSIKRSNGEALREPRTATQSVVAGFDHAGQDERAEIATQSESSTANPSRGWQLALLWAGGLWLAGSIVLVMIAAVRLACCLRGINRSVVECPADLLALVAELSKRLGLRRPVRLIVSASRVGPAVLGWLRPTIVLPAVIVRGTRLSELEPILAHELLHVRRGDLWAGLWQVLAQAVWWFHPLVWLANRMATRAAEACCDEAAIAELGCEPEHYARSLLAVLEQKQNLVTLPAFPGIRPVDVTRERLERIMQLGQGCRTCTPWWCWLWMGTALCLVLPGAALVGTAEEHPVQDRPPSPARQREDRQSGERKTVTINVVNDPGSLRQGERIDLLVIDESDKAAADGRVIAEKGEDVVKPPTFEEIVRAFPKQSKQSVPFLTETAREIRRINVELIALELSESRFYPNIGPAQLLRQHFKCTVRGNKTDRSEWPIPILRTDETTEVMYFDKAQLTVRGLDAILLKTSNEEPHEILVEVPEDQAERLTLAGGRYVVFRRGADRLSFQKPLKSWILNRPDDAGQKNDQALRANVAEPREEKKDDAVPAAATTAAITFLHNQQKAKPKPAPGELVTLTYSVADLVIRVKHAQIEMAEDGTASDSKNGQISFPDVTDQLRVIHHRSQLMVTKKKVVRTAISDQQVVDIVQFSPNELAVVGESLGSANVTIWFEGDSEPLIYLVEVTRDPSIEGQQRIDDGKLEKKRAGPAPTPAGAQASFTELMELIQSCVAPDSWEALSGPGSMMPYRTTLSLVVRQTPAVHEEIADLLGQLRRLQDLQCSFQINVISTVGSELKMPGGIKLESIDSETGAIFLTEAQLKTFRESIAVMEQAGTAAVVRGPKFTLLNGQGAELKLRRRRLANSGTVTLPMLQAVPVIAADRTAVRLQLAIGASKPLDAMVRTQGYVIKKGHSLLFDVTREQLRNSLAALVGVTSGTTLRLPKSELPAVGGIRAARGPGATAPTERVLLLITPQIVEIVEEIEELPGVDLSARLPLSAIAVEGNKTIPTREILSLIKSRTGRPINPKQLNEDIRTLVSSRRFVDVEARVADSSDGPVLIFRVTEKRD